jgi:hypothetical protein
MDHIHLQFRTPQKTHLLMEFIHCTL